MKALRVSTAVLLVVFGITAAGYAQKPKGEKPPQDQKKPPKKEKAQTKPEEQKAKPPEPEHKAPHPPPAHDQKAQERAQQQDQRAQQQRAKQVQIQATAQNRESQRRLSQAIQQQRISQQQQRVAEYVRALDQQTRLAQQQTAQLQEQHRLAQYRVQQAYAVQLQQQQASLRNDNSYDYNNDPYFYTPWTYRYNRGGRYYETNQYGADLLRQAVNNGYNEGFQAGQADRQDNWPFNYRSAYAYQDANYGYRGYYVGQGDYKYYFREGFRRGYEDGYYSRDQYGQRSANGKYTILGGALSKILTLLPIR